MSKDLAVSDLGFEAHMISVYDEQYHRSVVNLLPESMQNTIKIIPEKYRAMGEKEARKQFRPTPVMNQLRAQFWMEYNLVQTHQREKMVMANIFAGICTVDYFDGVVIKSKEMLAWMLIPPQHYQALLNEAWDAGMEKLRQIIDTPLYDAKGKLSIQAANLVVKVWQLLDQRKHGSVIQKHLNLNVSGQAAKEVAQTMEQNSMESLDFRLKEIKKKMARAEADEKEAAQLAVEVKPSDE